MKNILIISCVFLPEPVVSAQLSLDIATELSKNNSVVVLSPRPTRPENFIFERNNAIHSFEHITVDSYTYPKSKVIGRLRESYSFGKKCADYINENYKNIDIIYQNAWPLFAQYKITKTAKRNKIPLVIHVQDIYPESLTNKLTFAKKVISSLLMPLDKYILQNSSYIVCISKNMKKLLSETRKIDKKKFSTVSNWQNEEDFLKYKQTKQNKDIPQKPFTFMYLGNNGPVAGVDFLIESFAKADIDDSQLIIAGSGSKTDYCKTLALNLSAENVLFIPVPDGKVPEIQDIADVMLLPVKKGGALSSIPSKLPAYMFSAKTIIGSLDLESDTARAIIEANCGLVVEPENENALIKAMREISTMAIEQLTQKGLNGFHYAMKNFSRKTNLEKVVKIIQSDYDKS